MKRLILILSFATIVLSSSAHQAVLPQATAARFCQLLVCDNDEQLLSLTAFLRKNPLEANDSLTTEQLFCDYIFHYGGWQTLRIFPYRDGHQAHWYAATSTLPEDMPEEHQRYIQEVLLRMQKEVDAEEWITVDAYIDRLLRYQHEFGPVSTTTHTTSLPVPLLLMVLVVLFLSIPFIIAATNLHQYLPQYWCHRYYNH